MSFFSANKKFHHFDHQMYKASHIMIVLPWQQLMNIWLLGVYFVFIASMKWNSSPNPFFYKFVLFYLLNVYTYPFIQGKNSPGDKKVLDWMKLHRRRIKIYKEIPLYPIYPYMNQRCTNFSPWLIVYWQMSFNLHFKLSKHRFVPSSYNITS